MFIASSDRLDLEQSQMCWKCEII